jgi:hypothetical protein
MAIGRQITAEGTDAYKWRKRGSMYIQLTEAGERLRYDYN